MKLHNVFKPVKKNDNLTWVRIYSEGHVVAHFERRLTDLGAYQTVNYVKVAENLGVRFIRNTVGGILFRDPAMLFAALALPNLRIWATEPRLEAGSPKSKAKDIRVAQIGFVSDVGNYDLVLIPDELGGGPLYQPDDKTTYAELEGQNDCFPNVSIAERYPRKPDAIAAA